MTIRRALEVVLEVAMLAASLRGTGPLADSIRIVAVVVAALGAVVVFVAAVFAVAILDQRKPPVPV